MGSKLGPTIEEFARSEGELRSARRFLLLSLGRFGAIPEAIATAINACHDMTRLEAWFQQSTRITALDDFHPD